MRKICTLVTIASFVSASALGAAIGGFGSYWSSDDASDSYGYGLRLASTGDPAGYLELRVSRYDDFTLFMDGMDIELDVIPVDLGVTLNLGAEDSVELYLGGGGTFFVMDGEARFAGGGTRDLDLDNRWGYYGLMGFEFAVSDSIRLFGEGVYRKGKGRFSGDRSNEGAANMEFKMDGFGGNVGLLYMF